MMWQVKLNYKGITVSVNYDGLIGFEIAQSGRVSEETISAISNQDPILFEAIQFAMNEYHEIGTAEDVRFAGVEYLVKGKLPYNTVEYLEDAERLLNEIINNKYVDPGAKQESYEWLGKIRGKKAALIRKLAPPNPDEIKGFIYLLSSDSGQYKIGMTKNIKQRINQLKISVPFKIELIHSFPADNAREAEGILHKMFASQRMTGEWFSLDIIDIGRLAKVKRYEAGEFLYH